jgi:hypothetical protein
MEFAMKILLTLFLLVASTVVAADESTHFALALEFERLSGAKDKSKLVDSVLPAFAPHVKSDKERSILRNYLVGVMMSDEYLHGKAKAYMSIYSEVELKQLIELVKLPAYSLLQNKRYEVNVALTKNMQSLIQRVGPELLDKVKSEVEGK